MKFFNGDVVVLLLPVVAFMAALGSVHAGHPRHDQCRRSKVVPTLDRPYLDVVNFTEYALTPMGTTQPTCVNFTKTVWYRYTPTTDGVLTLYVNDFVERFFLKPGVNIGLVASSGSCQNLTEVACVDRDTTGFEIFYPIVRAGVTYYIQVGDVGDVGTGLVNVTFAFDAYDIEAEVQGDECVDAQMIPHASLPFNEVVDTRLYTNNPNDVATSCQFGGPDGNTKWYKYKPPSDGLFIVDTRGSFQDIPFTARFLGFGDNELNVVLGAYVGACNNLQPIFCTDEDGVEQMFLPVKRGVTYTIKLGNSFFGPGIANVTLSFRRNYFNLVAEGKSIAVLNDIINGEFVGDGNKLNILNYELINTTNLGLEAVFAGPVQSVRLQLGNETKSVCDNRAPFRMLGRAGKSNVPYPLGPQVIKATAYSRPNCTGKVITTTSQDFLVRSCNYLQYGLYDASRDRYVTTVNNASVIDRPPCKVNFEVTFQCGFSPRNVRLELRRASDKTVISKSDNARAPYFLFGDNRGTIPAGEYVLTAAINNIVHPSVRFNMGECKDNVIDKTFDIDIRVVSSRNIATQFSEYKSAKLFPSVVKRISSLIIGDKPDFTNTTGLESDFFCGDYPSRIDDLFICAVLVNYDEGESGILGIIFPPILRPSDNLPVAAKILFDETTFLGLQRNGKAESYILQQLIRTLGLGESWKTFGLANEFPPCSYNGTKAKKEFAALTRCSADIPLDQGTLPLIDGFGDFTFNCRFWDPTCLKNEVLTYTLGRKKISRITLGALEDLGYVVNYTAADPYGKNDIGTCAGCNRRNLQYAKSNDESPKAKTSCHSGIVHQRALHQGRKVLRDAHDHYTKQGKPKLTPEGLMRNQRVTVMYEHEDGMLCSVDVLKDNIM